MHLNAHNQFLQTQLGTGIVGSLLLFALLGAMGYYTYRSRRAHAWLPAAALFFVALFVTFGMTESLLEVQRGTLFFAFFYSFFAGWLVRCEVAEV